MEHLPQQELSFAVKPLADKILSSIESRLSTVDKTVWTLDNNQRGNPLKYQRFGSSNTFVKVTGRTCYKCITCNDDIGNENEKRVPLTYVNQSIVNPINFSIFEKDIEDMMVVAQVKNSLLRVNRYNGHAVKIDITGRRVSIYMELVAIANTVTHTIYPLLRSYNKSKDTFKTWKYQPDNFKCECRNNISRILHGEDAEFHAIRLFQQRVVEEWNPSSKNATALIIPPVSMRDEIKTDGYGMAIIELLCLSGILLPISKHNDVVTWELNEKWKGKTLYLCMDGLSLDRHRSFQRKLTSLPFSFDKAFRQSIIFQKAISRVVEISGPLYIALHMLQSIYIVYKQMMLWGQKIVQWKKLNVNKVSESFDTCRQLCMLMLEEIERVTIDLFVTECNEDLTYLCMDSTNESMAIKLSLLYINYINTFTSTDDRRLYMFGFVIMATEFRQYWNAVRFGDRITMESIQNKWIGVHLLVGKYKCVENYLNAIDLEYKTVDNITLQEIRMNVSCRYHEGNDRYGNRYPLHPLDEVQENVNLWTKKILLGPDEMSWRLHSPNVACAHMCVNHEESEYVKGSLDYSDLTNVKPKNLHRSVKNTPPSKRK